MAEQRTFSVIIRRTHLRFHNGRLSLSASPVYASNHQMNLVLVYHLLNAGNALWTEADYDCFGTRHSFVNLMLEKWMAPDFICTQGLGWVWGGGEDRAHIPGSIVLPSLFSGKMKMNWLVTFVCHSIWNWSILARFKKLYYFQSFCASEFGRLFK